MKYIVYNFILTKYSTLSIIFSQMFKKISDNEELKDNFEFKTIDLDDVDNTSYIDDFKLKYVPTIVVTDTNNNVMLQIVGVESVETITEQLKNLINGEQ